MPEQSKAKGTQARAADLKQRFAGLAAVPPAAPEPTPGPAARPAKAAGSRPAPAGERPQRRTGARRQAARPAAMPAEQPRPPAWDARISLTASQDMKRALELARINDGVEATARIRAMITLWQEDERLRARIDKLARTLR